MVRTFDEVAFERAFAEMTQVRWQEEPEYYPRYKTRYAEMLRRFAKEAPDRPLDVLDIGGGQLAYLAVALWSDRGCAADISDWCFPTLRANGIDAFQWDLARDDPPSGRQFD